MPTVSIIIDLSEHDDTWAKGDQYNVIERIADEILG